MDRSEVELSGQALEFVDPPSEVLVDVVARSRGRPRVWSEVEHADRFVVVRIVRRSLLEEAVQVLHDDPEGRVVDRDMVDEEEQRHQPAFDLESEGPPRSTTDHGGERVADSVDDRADRIVAAIRNASRLDHHHPRGGSDDLFGGVARPVRALDPRSQRRVGRDDPADRLGESLPRGPFRQVDDQRHEVAAMPRSKSLGQPLSLLGRRGGRPLDAVGGTDAGNVRRLRRHGDGRTDRVQRDRSLDRIESHDPTGPASQLELEIEQVDARREAGGEIDVEGDARKRRPPCLGRGIRAVERVRR